MDVVRVSGFMTFETHISLLLIKTYLKVDSFLLFVSGS